MAQHLGILGYPLTHSISPAFQQAALDRCGLDVTYHAWPTPPERLEAGMMKLRGPTYLGANVTIPHKERVPAYLDEVDSWALKVGAVNTIVKEGGRLVGYNTDSGGFLTALRSTGGFDPAGKSVLLLGAGGAARAAAFALADEKVASLTIANRSPERARSLAGELQDSLPTVKAIGLGDAASAAADADLIVNATALGMSGGGGERRTPLEAESISPGCLVYDMVYNPPETPLLAEARRAGARTLGGLAMLIHQGAASFRYWTGEAPPIEVMFSAGEAALAGGD